MGNQSPPKDWESLKVALRTLNNVLGSGKQSVLTGHNLNSFKSLHRINQTLKDLQIYPISRNIPKTHSATNRSLSTMELIGTMNSNLIEIPFYKIYLVLCTVIILVFVSYLLYCAIPFPFVLFKVKYCSEK